MSMKNMTTRDVELKVLQEVEQQSKNMLPKSELESKKVCYIQIPSFSKNFMQITATVIQQNSKLIS